MFTHEVSKTLESAINLYRNGRPIRRVDDGWRIEGTSFTVQVHPVADGSGLAKIGLSCSNTDAGAGSFVLGTVTSRSDPAAIAMRLTETEQAYMARIADSLLTKTLTPAQLSRRIQGI